VVTDVAFACQKVFKNTLFSLGCNHDKLLNSTDNNNKMKDVNNIEGNHSTGGSILTIFAHISCWILM